MASEPSSTTIASELSTSTSEIRTDATEVFQLEALSLNYLRNQDISTVPYEKDLPKLNPCSLCNKGILTFRLQAFTVLSCGHIFHRICLGEYIAQGETTIPLCPLCPFTIELFREEAVLASGKYHLQKKQTGTGQVDEALMSSLGFMDDDSHAGQGGQSKQVTMQDQATSPIVIEDDASENNDDERTPDASNRSANVQDNLENTPNENSGNDSQDSATNDGNNNTAQNRPLRRSPRHSSRQSVTSGNNNREHNILQGLLQELSTPVRGETIENNEVAEDDSEASMPKTLARLFQKACRAETRAMKAIQEEISCWYYYGKAYEERVGEIKNARRGVSDQSARNQVYDDTMEHLPGGFTKDTLRKKTQRAVKIFKLFRKIGVDKIKRVISYSANAISKLTSTQIRAIEQHFDHV